MNMQGTYNKKFDVFVSYSHADRKFVEDIAYLLHKRQVQLWYDGWQMKPGDVLRNRILHGIENANYFLVVISENSINSSWVQYELNAAMIEEIEKKHVKVIPSIIGNIEHEQLPLDLRAKYHLSFRNSDEIQSSIDALVDLLKPEHRERKELLQRLRNPEKRDKETIREMHDYAMRNNDQTIQIAAMSGLAKIGGSEAILILTERFEDMWGVAAIKKAITTLVKLRTDGGLLALTASLLFDNRFYAEKLEALAEGAKKLHADETYRTMMRICQELGYPAHWARVLEYRNLVPPALEKMANVSLDDIRYGAILVKNTPLKVASFWAGQITPPEKDDLDKAQIYAEQRVPGLLTVLSSIESVYSAMRASNKTE